MEARVQAKLRSLSHTAKDALAKNAWNAEKAISQYHQFAKDVQDTRHTRMASELLVTRYNNARKNVPSPAPPTYNPQYHAPPAYNPQYHATAPQYHAPSPPQYHAPSAYNVSLSCDVCINGNGYLKEHRSNCHHSIVPTVECYVYYNTLNKLCPYKCLTDLTIINGGVEAKLNQMHAEAQTKLRIFGRIPLSESMLEDYITFAQGMGSADHIAKGKQLNKDF